MKHGEKTYRTNCSALCATLLKSVNFFEKEPTYDQLGHPMRFLKLATTRLYLANAWLCIGAYELLRSGNFTRQKRTEIEAIMEVIFCALTNMTSIMVAENICHPHYQRDVDYGFADAFTGMMASLGFGLVYYGYRGYRVEITNYVEKYTKLSHMLAVPIMECLGYGVGGWIGLYSGGKVGHYLLENFISSYLYFPRGIYYRILHTSRAWNHPNYISQQRSEFISRGISLLVLGLTVTQYRRYLIQKIRKIFGIKEGAALTWVYSKNYLFIGLLFNLLTVGYLGGYLAKKIMTKIMGSSKRQYEEIDLISSITAYHPANFSQWHWCSYFASLGTTLAYAGFLLSKYKRKWHYDEASYKGNILAGLISAAGGVCGYITGFFLSGYFKNTPTQLSPMKTDRKSVLKPNELRLHLWNAKTNNPSIGSLFGTPGHVAMELSQSSNIQAEEKLPLDYISFWPTGRNKFTALGKFASLGKLKAYQEDTVGHDGDKSDQTYNFSNINVEIIRKRYAIFRQLVSRQRVIWTPQVSHRDLSALENALSSTDFIN